MLTVIVGRPYPLAVLISAAQTSATLNIQMSICIYAFLGKNIEDIEARVSQSFEAIGFDLQFHSETSFLESPPSGCIYVRINKTPPQLKRVSPDTPLFVAFEYQVSKRSRKAPPINGWPPKGVKQYMAVVSTRSAAGRSRSGYYLQALTLAILAKETGGYYYVDDAETALTGADGLEETIKGLNSPTELEFDADAFPFVNWPLNPPDDETFVWPEPIKSAYVEKYISSMKRPKRTLKLSLPSIAFGLLFLCVLIVDFLY